LIGENKMVKVTKENYRDYKPGTEVLLKNKEGCFILGILIGECINNINLVSKNHFPCLVLNVDEKGKWGTSLKQIELAYLCVEENHYIEEKEFNVNKFPMGIWTTTYFYK